MLQSVTSHKSELDGFCKHFFLLYLGLSLFQNCAQTTLQSFPKMPFEWKYYEVYKQDVNTGQRQDMLKPDAKKRTQMRQQSKHCTSTVMFTMLEM